MIVLTVVGARPQFVKAALISRALGRMPGIDEVLVHTGQHYDTNMSEIFFAQLSLQAPKVNLGVGSGPHGKQTGEMMLQLEPVMAQYNPDWVLIYGDTNSTLAAALVAAKLHLPIAHVEAGLRSYNRRMPEEINRVVADALSACLFCPTQTAIQNLEREGITSGVHHVGDVMLDLIQQVRDVAARSPILGQLGLEPEGYHLVTIHRAENTDDLTRLSRLLQALERLPVPVVFPMHPRTRAVLRDWGWKPPASGDLRLIEPVGYLEMVQLEANARAILTDSGGVQKEAFFLGRPCVTLREETEWVETLEGGWNVVAGTDPDHILAALDRQPVGRPRLSAFGDGRAAVAIAEMLSCGHP